MKLDLWQAIFDLLDAGGKSDYGRYILANNNGKLHRENGPAIICPDGAQEWYRCDMRIYPTLPIRPRPKAGPSRS